MAKISQWISQLPGALESFRRNYLIFPKYALLVSVLISIHILADKTVILITYITDTMTRPEIGLDGATLIVSVQEGVTGVLTLFMGHISITYSGPFKMILLSTLAYFVGLVLLLWQGVELLLWRDMIFYVAVFLIVVGRAGVQPLLNEFLATQLQNEDRDVDRQRVLEARTKFWWGFWYFLGSIGATFGMSNISDWGTTFVVTGILMGVGLLIFLSGFKLYEHEPPTKTSPLTTIYRVFKAAISKRNLPYPDDGQLSTQSRCLRWLDKATVIRTGASSLTPEEQERTGQLCTVREVNEVKSLFRAVPMLATFPIYALISVAGITFFFQQVAEMNDNFVSNVRVTPAFFILFQSISKRTILFIYWLHMKRYWPGVRCPVPPHARMVLGVLCAFLCCITAWYVEVRRLKYLSMSVFWLTPQFFLLGLMEGLVEDVLIGFYDDHLGDYIMRLGPFLSDFVYGISTFLNMFWILTGWIRPTINESRVDKCYLVLAILVIPNAIFYWYLSTYYFNRVESGDAHEENLDRIGS